ncbi:MAG: hypothetical protein MPW15_11990 [Candidatus Manganitrophus sp.]|nr:hypothetical protein [Candidatus Manganitrophus sp.]
MHETEKEGYRISARLPGPIMIYRQHYILIEKPTTAEAQPGAWPDALIPKVDEYFGERRSIPGEGRPAFPFDVHRGMKQGIWVDVYVPPDAPPGLYAGTATVTVGEKKAAVIPIRLTVPTVSSPFNLLAEKRVCRRDHRAGKGARLGRSPLECQRLHQR